jgi:hypothetical protein
MLFAADQSFTECTSFLIEFKQEREALNGFVRQPAAAAFFPGQVLVKMATLCPARASCSSTLRRRAAPTFPAISAMVKVSLRMEFRLTAADPGEAISWWGRSPKPA